MERLTITFPASGQPPKETCRQCRHRKVRCHGKREHGGACHNCERLRFACSFNVKTHDPRSRDLGGADAPAVTSVPEDKPELRRVSEACSRCRQHKIRCSGGFPCASCRRRSFHCEYAGPPPKKRTSTVSSSNKTSSPPSLPPPPPPPPESVPDVAMHDRRMSSSSSVTDAAASDHARNRRASTMTNHYYDPYPPPMSASEQMATQQIHQLPPPPPLAPNPTSNGPTNDMSLLVDYFFQHVYPMPSYAFFHPPTFRRKFNENRVEECLVAAIAAAASVRSPPSRRKLDLESFWAGKAEALIWENLESPSLVRLQAMLLVVLYRIETGSLRRAFMLSALAGRAAAAMRLNHERPGSKQTALEVRRRCMWSLKLVERYFSVGLPEFELCPVENLYIQLPCPESQFVSSVDYVVAGDDQGSYHICVQLEMLRRDLMKLTRSLALCEEPYPQLPALVGDFENHLERVGDQLPGGHDLSSSQWVSIINSQWLPRHLLMRLSWHQCQIDLHRLLLREFRESAPRIIVDSLPDSLVDDAERACIRHAKSAVRIIAIVNQETQDSRLLEFDSAICAHNASRILLFTARFGRTEERPSEEFAVSRAELCVAALRRFFQGTTRVTPIIDDIRRLIDESQANLMTDFTEKGIAQLPQESTEHRDPTSQLSSAAKTRQRLAVHSLLRQAGFSDEEDEQEDNRDTRVAQGSQSGLPIGPGLMSPVSQGRQAGPEPPAFTMPAHQQQQTAMVMDEVSPAQTTPDTQVDSEPWQHQFSAGGDLLLGQDMDTQALGVSSFSFPWLRRGQPELDFDIK